VAAKLGPPPGVERNLSRREAGSDRMESTPPFPDELQGYSDHRGHTRSIEAVGRRAGG